MGMTVATARAVVETPEGAFEEVLPVAVPHESPPLPVVDPEDVKHAGDGTLVGISISDLQDVQSLRSYKLVCRSQHRPQLRIRRSRTQPTVFWIDDGEVARVDHIRPHLRFDRLVASRSRRVAIVGD